MASHKEYVAFILEQFGEAEEVTARPMMGEYVIYCQGKVIGRRLRRPFTGKTHGQCREAHARGPSRDPL